MFEHVKNPNSKMKLNTSLCIRTAIALIRYAVLEHPV